jgi:hypothetical protein
MKKSSEDTNIKSEPTRREFLIRTGALSAGALIFGLSQPAFIVNAQTATTRRRPFVVYLHLGSWEGYSAGLMQATDVGAYPRGAFFVNQLTGHPNPNVNKHHKTGNLVLNDYTKVLEGIADHMMFAVANPQSLAHDEAFLIQQSGSRFEGASRTPMWAAGFAQATAGTSKASYVISAGSDRGMSQLAKTTTAVTSVTAGSINEVKTNFSDPATIPSTPSEAEKYAAIAKGLYSVNASLSVMSDAEKQGAQASIDGLRRGIPGIDSVKTQVESFMSRGGILSGTTFTPTGDLEMRLKDVPDKEAVYWINNAGSVLGKNAANNSTRGLPGVHDRLRLAAALIETQAASGIHINVPDIHDFHSGGAHVNTARAGCMVWAQIAQFWEWVKSKNYQNDVLVIVANEFNRTPANASSMGAVKVPTAENPDGVDVISNGTDHHLSSGFAFINGSLPPASRLGYIGDTFIPTGGRLNGGPQVGKPAYTSQQLVVSVFMRAFPGIFSSPRDAREIWQTFRETDVIPELVK